MHISITYTNTKVIVQSFKHLGTLYSLSNLTQCYVAFSITHDYLFMQKIYSIYISNVPSMYLVVHFFKSACLYPCYIDVSEGRRADKFELHLLLESLDLRHTSPLPVQ